MATEERPQQSRVILDPSVIFTDEALAWLADPEFQPWLAVSRALVLRLRDSAAGGQFLPYANPGPEQIERLQDILTRSDIQVFSFYEEIERGAIPPGAQRICETLLREDHPLGDVLADEWAFITSQSLAVIRRWARHSVDAVHSAGAAVIEISDEVMQGALQEIRDHLPPTLLEKMKQVDPIEEQVPWWLLAGGGIGAALLPHVGLPLAIAGAVNHGTIALAGDP
jgi:hypothetical protein